MQNYVIWTTVDADGRITSWREITGSRAVAVLISPRGAGGATCRFCSRCVRRSKDYFEYYIQD